MAPKPPTLSAKEVVERVCDTQEHGKDKEACRQFYSEQFEESDYKAFRLASVSVPRVRTSHKGMSCDYGDVGKYVQKRKRGSPFPPILLMGRSPDPAKRSKGALWFVWDGNHRVRAAQCVRDKRIAAFVPIQRYRRR